MLTIHHRRALDEFARRIYRCPVTPNRAGLFWVPYAVAVVVLVWVWAA